ncbi:hypothetical protein OC844_001894 [Tilletia horrida]|nr:hypothetical protein OC844_001894 [Tilletia horrida]
MIASGPSRLPLEALRQASRRAIGSVSSAAAAAAAASGSTATPPLLGGGSSTPGPGLPPISSTSPAAPAPIPPALEPGSAQPQRPISLSALRRALPGSQEQDGSSISRASDKEKEKEKKGKKEKRKEKERQHKWRGTGQIGELMHLPALLSPVRVPRNPIVLCHGLYGFDVRGPFLGLEIHYWAAVMDILQKRLGAKVIIRGVPGTGSIQARAEALHKFLCSPEAGVQGQDLNLVGHSMGGLDARHLISNIRPTREQYRPVSLTTICTPHHGSPFMDWCNANIGIGNDAIEDALREVKEERRGGLSAARKSDASQAPSAAAAEYRPPPYSLKSPIFVRQKKNGNGNGNGAEAKLSQQQQDVQADESVRRVASSSEEGAETSAKIVQRAKGKHDSAVAARNETVQTGASKAQDTPEKKEERTAKESESKASAIFDSISSAFSTLTGQFSDYMLSVLDTPAYAMLSTKYMNQVFNPTTPDDPNVKYYSVAARTRSIPLWHPLWLPKLILDAAAESRTSGGEADGSGDALGGRMQGNDGLVSVQSAQWGEFLGIVDGCDHWDLRGGGGPRLAGGKAGAEGKAAATAAEAGAAVSPAEAASASLEKAKEAIAQDKSWIDVNQLLGLWRSFKPSGKKDGEGVGAGSRSATDGISTAHSMSTLSASQQRHQHQQQQQQAQASPEKSESEKMNESGQHSSRPSISLEALRPSTSDHSSPALPSSKRPVVEERVGGAKAMPVAASASEVHDPDSQNADNVSDIVQTFIHAYSHLSDPKHEESDYDWSAAPSFTPTSDQESIITEIAQWISERLPQRDEGRRAEAEKEAAAQDQELEASERKLEQALSAFEASKGEGEATSSAALSTGSSATAAAASVANAAVASTLVQHGGAQQLGGGAPASLQQQMQTRAPSDRPQYRIRHKDEEEDEDEDEHEADRGKAAAPATAAAAAGSRPTRLIKDVEELELFWLAICHHLHARGF